MSLLKLRYLEQTRVKKNGNAVTAERESVTVVLGRSVGGGAGEIQWRKQSIYGGGYDVLQCWSSVYKLQ